MTYTYSTYAYTTSHAYIDYACVRATKAFVATRQH